MPELTTRWASRRLWWGIGLAVLLVVAVVAVVMVQCARASEPSPPTFELSEQPVSPPPTGKVIEGGLAMPEYWLAVGQQYRFDHDERGLFDQHPVIVTITEIGTRDDGRPWAQVHYQFDDGTGDAGTIRTYQLPDDHGSTHLGSSRLHVILTHISEVPGDRPAYVRLGAKALNMGRIDMTPRAQERRTGSEEVTMNFGGRFSTDAYQPLMIGGGWFDGPAGKSSSMTLGFSVRDTPRTATGGELYRGDSIQINDVARVTLLDYTLYPDDDPYAVGSAGPEGEMTVRVDWLGPEADQ